MLEKNEVVDQLVSLTQLDIDAVEAYQEAIDRIDIPMVRNKLIEFQRDHKQHITDNSALIRALGGEPPKKTPDLKGFFIQGFTAIRSMTGNEGALKAMKGNEELTNKNYAKALELDLPSEVRLVVQRNRDDERRHLEYIEQCLNRRVWEEPKKTAA